MPNEEGCIHDWYDPGTLASRTCQYSFYGDSNRLSLEPACRCFLAITAWDFLCTVVAIILWWEGSASNFPTQVPRPSPFFSATRKFPILPVLLFPVRFTELFSHIFVRGSCFLLRTSVRLPASAVLSLSHTTLSHATAILEHTTLSHTHTTLSETHNSLTRNFFTHTQIFNAQLFHTQLFHTRTQLCHTHTYTRNSFTHNFVTAGVASSCSQQV